jgi:hypothetical protein
MAGQGSLQQGSLQADQRSRDESSANLHPDWFGNHDHFDNNSVTRKSTGKKETSYAFRLRS